MASRLMVLPIVGLVFITWAVSLGGLASLQADCRADSYLGVRGFNSGILSCKKIYRYYWFIVVYEFVLIAGVAATALAGRLRNSRISWVGLFAVATLLYIQATDSFITAQSVDRFKHGHLKHRARLTTAGFLATAIINLFVIVVLGHKDHVGAARKDPVLASAV